MLITLHPGLKCKKCKERMIIAREIPGSTNLVMIEDLPIVKGDFQCVISCDKCMTQHEGTGFIRDGEFKGIHKYGIQLG